MTRKLSQLRIYRCFILLNWQSVGETFTFASPTKILGDVSPRPPIIAAPDQNGYGDSVDNIVEENFVSFS